VNGKTAFNRNGLEDPQDISRVSKDDLSTSRTFPRAPQTAFNPVDSGPLSNDTLFIDRKTSVREYSYEFADVATLTDPVNVKPIPVLNKKEPRDNKTENPWMYANANAQAVPLRLDASEVPKEGSPEPVTFQDGFMEYCSYSFKKGDSATIYVPGTPAEYVKGLQFPLQLRPDKGMYYRNQHIKKVPSCHFEPAAQATAIMNPKVTFDDINVMVNRSTLHYLSQFANNTSRQDVRLELAMVGDTLVISRVWRSAKIGIFDGKQFGHSFEEATTQEDPDLENGKGYYRPIGYSFGGLKLAVKIEIDAYVPDAECQY